MAEAIKIAVLGAGSWGTALAHHLSQAGYGVVLWGRDAAVCEAITANSENPKYFPNFKLHQGLSAVQGLGEALASASMVVFAVPANATRAVAVDAADHIDPDALVVSTAKGLERGSLKTMTEVLEEALGGADRVCALAGPSFAVELIQGMPTAVTVAGADAQAARSVADFFHADNFRVYTSRDLIGVEMGGVIKNVLAVAAGVVDGKCMGNNARAALITRGLAEMKRLSVALGADPKNGLWFEWFGRCLVNHHI